MRGREIKRRLLFSGCPIDGGVPMTDEEMRGKWKFPTRTATSTTIDSAAATDADADTDESSS